MAAFTPKIRPFALVFGALAAAVIVIGYFISTRPRDKAEQVLIHSAKERGLDVKAMLAARRAMGDIDSNKDIGPVRWIELKKLCMHPQNEVRSNALAAMMGLRKSDKRDEAIELCRTALKDTNEYVRSKAITGLWKLDAPEWRSVVDERMKTDTEWVRESCKRLLKAVEARARKEKAKQIGS